MKRDPASEEERYRFFQRASELLPELYCMAYAICGTREAAEYALQLALIEAWGGDLRGQFGFREGLRHLLRDQAQARQEAEDPEWDALIEIEELAQETTATRRMAALKYGCGLSARRVAQRMGMRASEVRQSLDRLERRVMRRLPSGHRRRPDLYLSDAIARRFAAGDPGMPSAAAIYRAFAAEADEPGESRRLAGKVLRGVTFAVLAAMCAVLFWLIAVLI